MWKQPHDRPSGGDGKKYFTPPDGVKLLQVDPLSSLPLEQAIINLQAAADSDNLR